MNLADLIEPHPAESVALVSRGRATTYGELRDQVARLRGGLQGLGIEPGDRVGIIFTNKRYFVDALLAVIGLGAVAVPLNPNSPAPEWRRELDAVGAKAVLLGSTALSQWRLVDRTLLPGLEHVVVAEADEPGARSLDDLLAAEPVPRRDVAPDDLAVLIFTSGTVGHPMAAMLTHRNLRSNLDQNLAMPDRIRPDDVVFGVLPAYHVFGLNAMLLLTLAGGASIVLVQRFDPSTALDTLEARRITVVPGVPSLWLALAHFPEVRPNAFATVRLAITGAAKMPEEAIGVLRARYGIEVREGYGLTEASPVVTSSTGIEARPGSIGRPIPGVDVRLVDPEGDDVPLGDAGEIWVRGPNVFAGYWNDPEATGRVLTPDGWLRTGDIAVADEDGYLYLVDRAKDLIIVSGFNVYPAEVEDVIAEYPGVREVAVVGVPHPHTGEAVKAYVVLAPDVRADEEQIIAFCRDNIARYKCPSKVLFVDELPKGMGGKLLRRVLR